MCAVLLCFDSRSSRSEPHSGDNHDSEDQGQEEGHPEADHHRQDDASGNLPTLKIGSRVRCTDDGVEGRIIWANGVSVKIEWTDGEKVTWRRDALASKPIEIIDADAETATAEEPNTEQPSVPTTAEQTTAHEESSAQEELPLPTPDVPPSEPIADAPAPEAIPEATPANSRRWLRPMPQRQKRRRPSRKRSTGMCWMRRRTRTRT